MNIVSQVNFKQLKFMERKSLAPFTHTVFTGKLPVRDHVWTAAPAPWAGNGGPGPSCESLVPALDEPAE